MAAAVGLGTLAAFNSLFEMQQPPAEQGEGGGQGAVFQFSI